MTISLHELEQTRSLQRTSPKISCRPTPNNRCPSNPWQRCSTRPVETSPRDRNCQTASVATTQWENHENERKKKRHDIDERKRKKKPSFFALKFFKKFFFLGEWVCLHSSATPRRFQRQCTVPWLVRVSLGSRCLSTLPQERREKRGVCFAQERGFVKNRDFFRRLCILNKNKFIFCNSVFMNDREKNIFYESPVLRAGVVYQSK